MVKITTTLLQGGILGGCLLFGVIGAAGCASSDDEVDSADPVAEDELKSGSFKCGDARSCKIGKEYCSAFTGGARPRPGTVSVTTYSCSALPSACGAAPSCSSCFPSSAGTGSFCGATRGNLTVRRLGP